MAPNESSRPKWGHLEYTWRLERLWELRALASIEALEEDGGDVIWSSNFGDEDHGVWRLKLYPYGDSSAGGRGHVSVFLALDPKKTKRGRAYAIFGCYVLDQDGNKMPEYGRSFTRQRFGEQSCSWGWSQFIKVEGQTLAKILVGEALVLRCQIDVFLGMDSDSAVQIPPALALGEEMRVYSDRQDHQDVRLIWSTAPDDETALGLGFKSSVATSNVTGGDGNNVTPNATSSSAGAHPLSSNQSVFEVNSFLLSARSPVFRRLLSEIAAAAVAQQTTTTTTTTTMITNARGVAPPLVASAASSPPTSSTVASAGGPATATGGYASSLSGSGGLRQAAAAGRGGGGYTSFGEGPVADIELSGGRLSSHQPQPPQLASLYGRGGAGGVEGGFGGGGGDRVPLYAADQSFPSSSFTTSATTMPVGEGGHHLGSNRAGQSQKSVDVKGQHQQVLMSSGTGGSAATLAQSGFDAKNPAVVRVHGITRAGCQRMVHFVKTDECEILDEICPPLDPILEVFEAASRYEVSALVWKTVKVLLGRLVNEVDALVILEKAVELGNDTLVAEAKRYLHTCSAPADKKELLANTPAADGQAGAAAARKATVG